MPSVTSHWREPGRRRRGSPESEDLPVAANSEPLAEGGFVLRRALIIVAVAAALAPSAHASSFPVTVHAANGQVQVKVRPTRIVSLSPTATEDLFAVGAGAQVVAVDDQSSYPAKAPRTKLSGYTPNAEAIAGYNPDLVVVSNDGGLVSSLQKLGLTVLLEPAAANLPQAYDEIRQLGAATGHDETSTGV